MANVIELIEQDHREVEQLFSEFQSSNDPSVAAKICDELTKHTFGEEQAVYPVVAEKVTGGESLASEAEKEHGEARQLIGRIRNTTDEAHLADLMSELKQAIEHHVNEEENEMLPKAREAIDTSELEQMGSAFEEAKESAGQR
jgi:hemerythrin superfamily protein